MQTWAPRVDLASDITTTRSCICKVNVRRIAQRQWCRAEILSSSGEELLFLVQAVSKLWPIAVRPRHDVDGPLSLGKQVNNRSSRDAGASQDSNETPVVSIHIRVLLEPGEHRSQQNSSTTDSGSVGYDRGGDGKGPRSQDRMLTPEPVMRTRTRQEASRPSVLFDL